MRIRSAQLIGGRPLERSGYPIGIIRYLHELPQGLWCTIALFHTSSDSDIFRLRPPPSPSCSYGKLILPLRLGQLLDDISELLRTPGLLIDVPGVCIDFPIDPIDPSSRRDRRSRDGVYRISSLTPHNDL